MKYVYTYKFGNEVEMDFYWEFVAVINDEDKQRTVWVFRRSYLDGQGGQNK